MAYPILQKILLKLAVSVVFSRRLTPFSTFSRWGLLQGVGEGFGFLYLAGDFGDLVDFCGGGSCSEEFLGN